MAAGFAEAAAPVAATLAATGVLFVVAVASAAFFLVGIVAFRSIVAAAFAAAVLLELFAVDLTEAVLAVFGVGLAVALVGGALVLAFEAAFAATLLRAGTTLAAFALLALAFVTWAVGLTVVRALAVAGLFAAGRAALAFWGAAVLERTAGAARVALARLTDGAACVAVRAAILDAVTGLAVRRCTGAVVFVAALTVRDLVAGALAVGALLVDFATEVLTAKVFAADVLAAFARAGLGAAAPALRPRAAGLVLGDIGATPEIGRPLSCVIDDDVPRERQGT